MLYQEHKMKVTLAALVIAVLLLMPFIVQAQVPTPPDVPTLGPIIICDQGNFLNVSSPRNQNYPTNPIQLTFTVVVSTLLGQFGNVGYSVDGGVVTSIRNLPTTETRPDPQSGEWYYYTETASASFDLPQLTDGAHNVTVYYGWQYLGIPENPSLQRFEVYAYQTVNFTIGIPQPTLTPSPVPTASPSSTPTPTTAIPEFSWIVVVPLLLSLFSVAVMFWHRKTKSIKLDVRIIIAPFSTLIKNYVKKSQDNY
jgi:hypothetical protein